ncbi:DUF861 domain-containing protein [Vibrio parahaemolyticus]|uniref:cupin domain-containing protein n=1 Tax=Vibrio parahaemolyticus TaxID=670 RepID=UPI0006A65900|nr:cupin domain-containing protein [Vibrio parahaemolyticus]EHD6028061.1 DUF861 domain-containing protein [Vibrio parahaemolyticus]EJR0956376.1 DUF861 domain-containing protein [Vibrio parahaemolyticus]EKY4207210.1 DUF861 domain-containing protein [Vibrio parahaemolyticus]EMA9658581.1 DUF861 domain-containing protein [Vibrio parahaemolyticus]KOE96929.1 hypothetical protein ACS88_01905 [Vibrio parahaemolyticus]
MTKTMDDIVVLGTSEPIEKRHIKKQPERLLSGDPDIFNSLFFKSDDGKFTSGIWESNEGKFVAIYDEDEFYYMLSGCVVISDQEGNSTTYHPGDCIVVPAGFKGTWEVLEPTKKFYAHYKSQ